MELKFNITGLDCANCASELETSLSKIDGMMNVNINFITQKMNIIIEETKKENILKEIKKIIKKEEPDVEIELI